MSKLKKYRFSIAGQPLYPHIKLTRELFPRLLATRIPGRGDTEYFGAFLNRTSVRILLDFLNKTFRLRSCDIDIDGSFDVPCTQFYAKRCTAPCVESLCSLDNYLEIVALVRLFLSNDRERFEARILDKIDEAAGKLNFEKAAFLRDIRENVAAFWQDKKLRVWLDDAVDTIFLEKEGENLQVYLVSQRGQRFLGERKFTFHLGRETTEGEVLPDLIEQFYLFHAPREIRVSTDFVQRRELSRTLSSKFERRIKIVVVNKNTKRVTTERALERKKEDEHLENIKPRKSFAEIQFEFRRIFGLSNRPNRIEAFDVAHISGSYLVAAKSVWENGNFVSEAYEHWFSDQTSELKTLQQFIRNRFTDASAILPNLILLDGGKAHLQAALQSLDNFPDRNFKVISAVKPGGKHSEISHFILEDGTKIDFDADSEAHRILKILRDDAHELSNSAHRSRRDMSHFYELAAILPSLNEKERQNLLGIFGSVKKIRGLDAAGLKNFINDQQLVGVLKDIDEFNAGKSRVLLPLIVPIRFHDPDGNAEDLRPIKYRQNA